MPNPRIILTLEEFRSLIEESDALVLLAQNYRVRSWAAAIAGLRFIRYEIARGADPEWWAMMLTVEDPIKAMTMELS